ncbi:MAG TPA: DUF1844 domain-containing protein [Polyangiaceae bacterium]|nr:DUF1844 domain-containing protein [Polyangiaceae bacterium]
MTTPDEERNAGSGESPPQIDFATFVVSLSHSGFVHLGDVVDPGGDKLAPNLELAKQTIDLLAVLEEKTRGNLTGEEERILSAALYDLRMRFVEVSKKQ